MQSKRSRTWTQQKKQKKKYKHSSTTLQPQRGHQHRKEICKQNL